MKLLLDQGLPRTGAALLREAGFDAVHVGELGMAFAEDGQILERARQDESVVVTLDADFHALLALAEASRPSVIRLRVEGLRGWSVAELIKKVVAACSEELEAGAAVTADLRRVRIRKLPLRG